MSKKQNYIWKNDRNFDLDEYEQQKYYYVAEANDLIIRARHDLTARELKIMDFIISKIQPEDTDFTIIKTSMYELTNVLNLKKSGTTYSQLAKTLDDLRIKSVVIYSEDNRSITQTGWLKESTYWENGKVELELSKKLAPFLLGLKNNYTQYLLLDTVQLKSKYSILLYKLMRECDKSKGKEIAILQGTPDDFKKWLGAPQNYDYKRLKDNILKKAVAEINLKIEDMDLEIFQARRGRSVVHVEIHNNWTRT